MFSISEENYELVIDDYVEKGAQITMKKRKPTLPFIPVVVLIVSCLVLCYKDVWFHRQQLLIVSSMLSVVLVFFINHVRNVHTESILVIASIGVTVQQSSLLGTNSRFYDICQIEDVVIVEAVTMSKIIFQLVLLPKQRDHSEFMKDHLFTSNSAKCTDKLHPLFQSFRPKLEDLQTIYRHIQEKLILPNQAR